VHKFNEVFDDEFYNIIDESYDDTLYNIMKPKFGDLVIFNYSN
jgi:hypothetical protein